MTYSLSRLARSTRDAIGISERSQNAGADLVSLSERLDTATATGKMVFRLLAVLAEFERDLISERTSAAMQHKRARHEYTGGAAPYGWRVASDGVKLEAHAAEQALIQVARGLRGTGLSLRRVGRSLDDKGSASAVRRILAPENGQWPADGHGGMTSFLGSAPSEAPCRARPASEGSREKLSASGQPPYSVWPPSPRAPSALAMPSTHTSSGNSAPQVGQPTGPLLPRS